MTFAGAALGFSLLIQPKVYGAQAEFLLTPRPDLSDAAVDRATQTQVQIVTSPAVLQPVADQAHVRLRDLQDAVSADMVGRTNILRITVGDRDPRRALALARLVASRYSQVKPPAATAGGPQLAVTVLTPARRTDGLLQPRPLEALAAGALIGLVVAALAVVLLWQPWRLLRPSPFWT